MDYHDGLNVGYWKATSFSQAYFLLLSTQPSKIKLILNGLQTIQTQNRNQPIRTGIEIAPHSAWQENDVNGLRGEAGLCFLRSAPGPRSQRTGPAAPRGRGPAVPGPARPRPCTRRLSTGRGPALPTAAFSTAGSQLLTG